MEIIRTEAQAFSFVDKTRADIIGILQMVRAGKMTPKRAFYRLSEKFDQMSRVEDYANSGECDKE